MIGKELETFDIRNFIDHFEPAKEKNKYICLVCGGNDLSVDPNTGAYQCFNGCNCADIREKVRPWSEVREVRQQQQKSGNTLSNGFKKLAGKADPSSRQSSKKFEPVPLPEGSLAIARLAEVPNDVPQPIKPPTTSKPLRDLFSGKGATSEELQKITVTSYNYGDNKQVHRYQCPIAAIEKGYEKTFLISRVDESGKTVWNKGAYAWQAYRQLEAIAALSMLTPVGIESSIDSVETGVKTPK